MGRSIDDRDDRSIVGSDFLQLRLGEAPPGGLADWLTGRLREAIADGRLGVGSRLPATRVLATELGVSRGVVTEAYRRLIEDGHVAGRGRAGTTVLAAPVPTDHRSPPPTHDHDSSVVGGGERRLTISGGRTGHGPTIVGAVDGDLASERRADKVGGVFGEEPGDEVFDSLRMATARIDLSPGVPDLAAFPRTAWLRAERAVLDDLSPTAFGYGDPRGAPRFREAVATWLGRYRGIGVDPGEVIVVAGVAQALSLLAQVLRRDGIDTLAVEDPGSLGARQHLASTGLRLPPVAVDDDGLRVDELVASGAPAVLVTPAHQFPTGVVLGGHRRRELIGWAGDGGLVIEDDYDAEHRYDRPPVAAVHSLVAERVCYTGSVSKILAPALRVGWTVVPRRYHDDVVAAKRWADLGNAVLPQLVLAELMASGELERHLRQIRRRHRRRRDAMIDALRTSMPQATVHGAAAGLHLMVTLDVDDTALAAAALERGVKVQPLSWHRQRPGASGLVLGYAARPAGEITDGITVIAEEARRLSR